MAKEVRLFAAARSGKLDVLKELLADETQLLSAKEPSSGATPLHLAAAGGYDECVEALLDAGADCAARDSAGSLPLHSAAQSCIPMCAYQLASRAPGACLEADAAGRSPIQLAACGDRGEVLNAMLLACAAHASGEALGAMRALLAAGAVCDTWAPNGSSALMLAASADCAEGCCLLLDHAASLELQDALGRTALMFAAGNNARAALVALLDRGASVSTRDRRGRGVLDYAAAGSEVRAVLDARIGEMEARAARLQEELLAELLEGEEAPAQQQQQQQQQKGGKKGGKKQKKKAGQQAKAKPAAAAAAALAEEPEHAEAEAEPSDQPADASANASEPQRPTSRPTAADEPAAGAEGKQPGDGDERPPSPDGWQVVGSKQHRQQQGGGGPAAQRPPSQLRPAEGGRGLRRCPSASSLDSASSGESHGTAGSSQRSVLIPPSRCGSSAARGPRSASAKPAPAVVVAAPAPAKPAWGRPAALAAQAPQPAQQPEPEQQQLAPAAMDDAAYPPLAAAAAAEPATAAAPEPAPALEAAQLCAAAGAEGVPAGLPLAEARQDAASLAAEVASLRAQLAALQLEKRLAEQRHQKELAAVLEETAAHEAAAVAKAAAAERMHCIVRFTAMLQNTSLGAELLSSHGLGGSAAYAPALVPPATQGAGLSFLGFPPLDGRAAAAAAAAAAAKAAAPAASLLCGDGCGSGGTSSPSPLSCSPPFCYSELEQRLRTEFSGDVSSFVQPATAAELDALVPLPADLF